MKRSLITLTIISMFLALYLIGCGGGDGVSTLNPTTPSGDGTGSLVFSVQWPDEGSDLSAQLIHPNVTKIAIDVQDPNGTSLTTAEIVRTAGSTTETKTVSGIRLGSVNVYCKGLDAGGNIISSRMTKNITVSSTPTNVTATLGVTIINNTFVPKNVPISPGDIVYWGNADTVKHIVQFTTNSRTFTLELAAGELKAPTFTDADLLGPVTIKLYNDIVADPALDEGSVTVTVPSGQVYQKYATWGTTAQYPHNAVDGHNFIAVDKNGNFFVAMHNPQIPFDITTGLNNASDLYIPGEKVLNSNASRYTKFVNRIEKYNSSGVHNSITFDTSSIDQIVGIAVDHEGGYLYVSDNQMAAGDDNKSPVNYSNITEDRVLKFDAQSGGSPQDIITPPDNYNATASGPGAATRRGALYFDGHFPQGLAVSPDGKYLFICDAHVVAADTTLEPMVHEVNLKEYNPTTGTNYTWTDTWVAANTIGWPYRTNQTAPFTQATSATPSTTALVPVDVAVSGDTTGVTNATVWFACWNNAIIQRVGVTTGAPTEVTVLNSGRFDITGLDLRWATSTTTASDLYLSCINAGNGVIVNYNGVGGSTSFTTILTGHITGWPGSLNAKTDVSGANRAGGILSVAVAPNQDGTLYVGDDYHRVTQYARSSSGSTGTYSFSKAWRLLYEAFDYPVGIAYDNANGYVYVTDRVNCRVLKYNSLGVYELQWGIPPHPSDVIKPDYYECAGTAMAITDTGVQWTRYIFEEPTYAYNALNTLAGSSIASIVSLGSGLTAGPFNAAAGAVTLAQCNAGEFFMPQGIAVSHDGSAVYVVDWALNPANTQRFGRVQKFNSVGTWQLQWYKSTNLGEFVHPKGVAVDKSGFVYLSWFAGTSGLVEQFNADGTASGKAFTAAPGAVAIDRPEGVAIDYTDTTYPSGILYVADKYNHRIIKYDVSGSGTLLGQVGTTGGSGGSDAGEVKYPAGLAVDNSGYLYAVDAGNKRVQKWSSHKLGNGFVCIFNTPGELLDPWGIAVAPDGSYAYVADSRDNRVILYKAEK
ncbi:MAG: hypothetical protein ABRQ38_10080 [Candidatus Eremiobacterota bacterium]